MCILKNQGLKTHNLSKYKCSAFTSFYILREFAKAENLYHNKFNLY